MVLIAIAILTRSLIRRLEHIDLLWERTWRQIKLPQATEAVIQCQRRFEHIVYDLMPKVMRHEYDINEFYDLYWGLQVDQYHFWKQNLIDDEIYSYWLTLRHLDWSRNQSVGNISPAEDFS